MVSGVFGSFMLTCNMKPSWFPFSDFKPAWWNKSFLEQNHIFRWFHVVPGVLGSFILTCYMEPSWFPFQIFNPLSEINHFWYKNCIFFRWFHVVPGVFGSFMLTWYMEPSWFPFSDFKPAWWNKSVLEQNHIFLDGSMWFPVFLAPLC